MAALRLPPLCTPSTRFTRPFATFLPSSRLFTSSSSVSSTPVPLASDTYSPKSPPAERKGPLVVLHGLFGSKQNWRSQARGMAHRLGRDVITLDLRNHGLSPHAPEASYADLAGDVRAFIDQNRLEDVCLVGHSMGGKVAMALTLEPHDKIKQLVVIDIAPGIGAISPEFRAYLDAMKEINAAQVKSRKEADKILEKTEPDLGVRQFLLTNLVRSSDTSPYTFRLPVDFLSAQIDEIGSFPYPPGSRSWQGPTLVLKGAKSKYINRRNIPLIQEYFPKMQLQTLETGHWVHAEKPKEFLDELERFLAQD